MTGNQLMRRLIPRFTFTSLQFSSTSRQLSSTTPQYSSKGDIPLSVVIYSLNIFRFASSCVVNLNPHNFGNLDPHPHQIKIQILVNKINIL
jgi:hypothetical protein